MIKLLSHLSYVAITSPDVEASVDFYVNQVGLTIVDRIDGKVYLRCWGDYYKYSVVVAPGDEPSLVTAAWRTSSPEALEEAAKRVEAAGIQGEWVDVHKIGRAYRFTGPWGHTLTLHWDVTRHHDTEGDAASIYPDRPSRRSKVAGAPRQLDHVTIATSDVDAFVQWYVDVLGFRFMARTQLDEAPISVFSVLTTNEKSHDLGVVLGVVVARDVPVQSQRVAPRAGELVGTADLVDVDPLALDAGGLDALRGLVQRLGARRAPRRGNETRLVTRHDHDRVRVVVAPAAEVDGAVDAVDAREADLLHVEVDGCVDIRRRDGHIRQMRQKLDHLRSLSVSHRGDPVNHFRRTRAYRGIPYRLSLGSPAFMRDAQKAALRQDPCHGADPRDRRAARPCAPPRSRGAGRRARRSRRAREGCLDPRHP